MTQQIPPETEQPVIAEPRSVRIKRVAVGVALAAVPLAAVPFILHLKQTDRRSSSEMEKNFNYDTASLRKVDPALIKYQQVGRIDSQFKAPRAIALDAAGQLYVSGESAIRVFSATGAKVRDIVVSTAPQCLAVAPDGTVYAGIGNHVEVFGADGNRQSLWAPPSAKAFITSIAVSATHVWVAVHDGRGVIYRYSKEGNKELEIGRKNADSGYPGLITPSPHMDLAMAPDGKVWVANPGMHRLEAWRADGQLHTFWGKPGTAVDAFFGCCNPSDFAMLADGSIVTAEKGLGRVKVHKPDGRLDCLVASPEDFAENMLGLDVAADSQGRIFVLEPGGRNVRIFARKDGGQP